MTGVALSAYRRFAVPISMVVAIPLSFLALHHARALPGAGLQSFVVFLCVLSALASASCRTVWSGVVQGSFYTLTLCCLLRSLSIFGSSAAAAGQDTLLCLLPLLAAFWAALCFHRLTDAVCKSCGTGPILFAYRIALLLVAITSALASAVVPTLKYGSRSWAGCAKTLAAVHAPAFTSPESYFTGGRFENLGTLPRTILRLGFSSAAHIRFVSAAGDVVVGSVTGITRDTLSGQHGRYAYLWTEKQGAINLGSALGTDCSEATGASADGRVVIGTRDDSMGPTPFLRRRDGSIVYDETPSRVRDVHRSDAHMLAVSPDGDSVLSAYEGTQFLASPEPGGGSTAKLLPEPLGAAISMLGASARWCVGSNGNIAFRWTPETGREAIMPLSGERTSNAACASDDGIFVVGTSGSRLFRWTARTGSESLGSLVSEGVYPSDADASHFFRISNDGTAIAGIYADHPFLWVAGRGIEDLKTAMLRAGANTALAGLPVRALALSSDGAYVTGFSQNDEGNLVRWRLYLK